MDQLEKEIRNQCINEMEIEIQNSKNRRAQMCKVVELTNTRLEQLSVDIGILEKMASRWKSRVQK